MMRHCILLAIAFLTVVASAQRLNRMGPRPKPTVSPLVELMPFAEAATKAKNGDGAGYYAVALHYALGREIESDRVLATIFLAKAVEVQYPPALLVDAMVAEESLFGLGRPGRRSLLSCGYELRPVRVFGDYTGGASVFDFNHGIQSSTSCTNVADVVAVKALYEIAFKSGISAATNELARFEKRISVTQQEIEEVNAHQAMLVKNAQLAKDLLGECNTALDAPEATSSLAELCARRQAAMQAATQARATALVQETEAREAERAAEREQAAAEREQQRQALLQIQEDLRRQREERVRQEEKSARRPALVAPSSLDQLRSQRAPQQGAMQAKATTQARAAVQEQEEKKREAEHATEREQAAAEREQQRPTLLQIQEDLRRERGGCSPITVTRVAEEVERQRLALLQILDVLRREREERTSKDKEEKKQEFRRLLEEVEEERNAQALQGIQEDLRRQREERNSQRVKRSGSPTP